MSTHAVSGRIYQFGLHDRLRAAREHAGHTVREFEALTGISKSSIGNYEAGKTTPRRPQLAAWALATGFDLEWLETGKEPSPHGGGLGSTDDAPPTGLEPVTLWYPGGPVPFALAA